MRKIKTCYIGTYTNDKSEGIYKFDFNEHSGELSNIELASKIENPTYLCINTLENKLYSVIKDNDNNNLGGVASFNIEKDASLQLTNKIMLEGNEPCHISLIENNNFIISSNYDEKNIIAYSLDASKAIKNILDLKTHLGDAHIHYAYATPDNKYISVVDLGRNEVCLYEFKNDKLLLKENLIFKSKAGSGPRHMIFSPCGNFAYVLCELSNEIIILRYLGDSGFKLIGYISTLPENYTGTSYTAAIRITSDGKYLYASNRGHNSIATYKINIDGTLILIGYYDSYGHEPRDFNLSPNERYIIIGNHRSDNITVYERLENGTLKLIAKDIYAPSPVCIAFL